MIITKNDATLELLHGDCLELMAAIPDGSVDLILCDLPYGVTDAEWDRVIPYDALWRHYDRALKRDGTAVLFAAQPFSSRLIGSNPRAYRYSWYWIKPNATGFTFAKYQPMRRVEEICVFYRQHGTYNPQGLVPIPPLKRRGSASKRGGLLRGKLDQVYTQLYTNYPVNTLEFDKERGLHPTQKPVPLLEYLVRTYTNAGGVILDNCMGSGSTGAAVARAGGGRRFIGIEANEKFYNIAVRRFEGRKGDHDETTEW